MSDYKFRSQTIAYAAGRQAIPLNFLPRFGDRGGRLVVDRILLECNMDLTTGAGVTLAARDIPGLVGQIEVKDAGGYRRNMLGIHAYIWAQHLLERETPDLPAAIVANMANQLRVLNLEIPFTQPHVFDPTDYSMAVDDLLDGGEIALTMPATAQLNWAGGVGVINAGTNYQLLVECHEEFDVQLHCRDVINFQNQQAVASIDVTILGNILRNLYLWSNAAGGGASVAPVVDVTIDAYRYIQLTRNQLLQSFLTQHDAPRVLADGYVYNSVAQPLIWEGEASQWKDSLRINSTLLGRLTSTLAIGQFLYHVHTPRDPRVDANALAANNVSQNAKARVKTSAKSMQDPAAWGPLAPFTRLKMVEPRAPGR